jgi:MoxR-like ATPase
MSTLAYQGNGGRESPVTEAGHSVHDPRRRPQDYIAESGLVNAVNVALMLDKPLLLTGEPGTGKSQLAHSLAWELNLGDPLVFATKSTSVARDLFYTFDSVGRFKAADHRDALSYLTYNALGKAILFANDEQKVTNLLPTGTAHPGRRQSVVLIDEVDKAPRDFPNDILNEIDYQRF